MGAREVEKGAREAEGEGNRNREVEESKWVWRGARKVVNVGEGGKEKERGKSSPAKAPSTS
jgi:hypothetical protein